MYNSINENDQKKYNTTENYWTRLCIKFQQVFNFLALNISTVVDIFVSFRQSILLFFNYSFNQNDNI